MLTGSFASNVHGRVRSTFDADLVVALQPSQWAALRGELGPAFYVDAESFSEAQRAGQFNAIHQATGLKIDFYLPRRPRDHEALRRRRMITLWGAPVSVIAPEDLILAKLRWAKEGGSARQLEDARGILEVQKGELDLAYLREQAAAESVLDLFERITD